MTSTNEARYLVDTNVLLRLVAPLPGENFGKDLRGQLGRDSQLCIAQQSLFEFWTVVTRPVEVNGMAQNSEQAFELVSLLRKAFQVLPDPEDLLDRWLNLCKLHAIRGKPAHDARLIAVAQGNGISQLVTLNGGHFQRFEHIHVIEPKLLQR